MQNLYLNEMCLERSLWKKFNKSIKKYGVGFYPEILTLVFRKE